MFAWKLASRVLPPSAGFSGATLGVRHANTVYVNAPSDRVAQAACALRPSPGQSQLQRTTDLTVFWRGRFLFLTVVQTCFVGSTLVLERPCHACPESTGRNEPCGLST